MPFTLKKKKKDNLACILGWIESKSQQRRKNWLCVLKQTTGGGSFLLR